MKRLLIIVSLLWAANALAESQEELYYRALKAEESGDIPRALDLFDSAVAVSGPYTDEIQEIINDYQSVLKESDEYSADDSSQSPWSFHTYGTIKTKQLRHRSTNPPCLLT